MEDCCAVCAEPLEWVGYGVCGHQDVCSMCIARLRFVLNDRRCCICKQECSCVFVTKALGEYTKIIKDFANLRSNIDLSYEKNIQAFFDDKNHFEMVKAMCRLLCRVCEGAKGSDFKKEFVKKGHVFESLEQLQQHLSNVHNLQMCGLCLEGRKIFISEQKLYNKGQLDNHSAEGDAEIDGIGEEKGGFRGHPPCNFCQRRFYSDNELYQHMSVDHYACHICQRLHPGQYDYFHNYDDLEAHFLHKHFLCEHPDCLAKKFVVFKTDTELKWHIASAHGDNMRRSQRNTYLKIPVDFHYRRPSAGYGSSNSRTLIHVANSDIQEPLGITGLSNNEGDTDELSSTTESPILSDNFSYRTAIGGDMPPTPERSAFPPLPGSKHSRHKTKQRMRASASSSNGAASSEKASSASSAWHTRSENAPCSSSGTANLLNKQLLLLGKSSRSGGELNVMNVTDGVNIGSTSRAVNKELQTPESCAMNGIECGFQLTDEVRRANKTLNECIRSRLRDNLKTFMEFKDLSAQFRKGDLAASLYCEHAKKLGMWDLLPELARLCPEPEKQKALLSAFQRDIKGKQQVPSHETQHRQGRALSYQRSNECVHKACSTDNLAAEPRLMERGATSFEANKEEKNGYGGPDGRPKTVHCELNSCSSKGSTAENCSNNEAKPLRVDAYNGLGAPQSANIWSCAACTLENSESETKCAVCETSRPVAARETGRPSAAAQGHGKRTNKASKFERSRLSEKDQPSCTPPPLQEHGAAQRKKGGGAWNNGGGQRLLAMAQRDATVAAAWRR